MSKRIEMELFRYKNVLFGSVQHIDESLRGIGVIKDDGAFDIRSDFGPSLDDTTLWVHGDGTDSDSQVFINGFDSETVAIVAAKHFKDLVDAINREGNTINPDGVVKII